MIKIIAVICQLAAPDVCRQQVVTTSDYGNLTMTGCLVGMPALVDWIKQFPGYRLDSWRCSIGGAEKEHA